MHPQRMGNQQQIRIPWIPPTAFVALDAAAVDTGEVAEFLL